MSLSLILGCVWVLAGAVISFMPMRRQFRFGPALLISAPILVVWIGNDYGWWVTAICVFAIVSMFRLPIMYYYRRARGENPEVPK